MSVSPQSWPRPCGSTKDVPVTDGCKRNLRHEGHNLNVLFGSLTVFVTFNFADTYAPLLFKLCSGEDAIGDIVCDLSAEQPDMPSLHRMHQLIAESPRSQVFMGQTLMARVCRPKAEQVYFLCHNRSGVAPVLLHRE